jgi:phage gp46-like protein
MDVKIIQDSQTKEFDIGIKNDEFVLDAGLETSVLISLFSDSREDTRTEDKRGWWGASVLDEDRLGAVFGSKLWLLLREKQTEETLVKIREWCNAALQWMIDEQIALAVDTEAEYLQIGIVAITIKIERGERDPLTFRYQYLWDGQYGGDGS